MDSIRSQLIDMGFHETKIDRAISSCPDAKTFEQVMEWLIAHDDELNKELSSNNGNSSKTTESTTQPGEIGSSASSSSVQDDQTVESTDTASTASKKKITVDELQQIIAERLSKRAEEERKKQIEDEKKRRIDGQKMLETRSELQDQERVRLAEQIRREKQEKELHRKRVLDQIASDREAMRQKNNPKPDVPVARPRSSCSNKPQVNKTPVNECKIALRFPDGSNLVQKFSPQEQLSAVRLFVQMEKKLPNEIEFVAPPSKKLTKSMMDDTLESLGLCPASRLEVKYQKVEWDEMD